jgi:hypothetical protein
MPGTDCPLPVVEELLGAVLGAAASPLLQVPALVAEMAVAQLGIL